MLGLQVECIPLFLLDDKTRERGSQCILPFEFDKPNNKLICRSISTLHYIKSSSKSWITLKQLFTCNAIYNFQRFLKGFQSPITLLGYSSRSRERRGYPEPWLIPQYFIIIFVYRQRIPDPQTTIRCIKPHKKKIRDQLYFCNVINIYGVDVRLHSLFKVFSTLVIFILILQRCFDRITAILRIGCCIL